jgi:hypothetical protein
MVCQEEKFYFNKTASIGTSETSSNAESINMMPNVAS